MNPSNTNHPNQQQHNYQQAPQQQHTFQQAPQQQHSFQQAPPQHNQQQPIQQQQAPPQHNQQQAPPQHHTQQIPPQHHTQQAPPQHHTQQAPPQHYTQQAPPQHNTQQIPPQHIVQQAPPQHYTQQDPPQHTIQQQDAPQYSTQEVPPQPRYAPLHQYPETETPTQHKYPPLHQHPTPQVPEETIPEAPPTQRQNKHPLLMPGSILAMWADAVDGLLQEDNGDAALLYLHIMRKGHDSPQAWTEARTLNAQILLRHLGLYRPEACTNQPPKPENKVLKETAPQYSTADINLRLSDQDQIFLKLNRKLEDLRSKELSMPDLKILLEIHDYLGFSPDVILLLYSFVTGRYREQHGAYAIPPMKDVRHEANYWSKAGVKDVATAEELILKRMQRDQWEGKLEHLFKTRITDSARKHTNLWKTWNMPDTFFELALDRTLYYNGKFSWAYIHKILENWHIHHYQTIEEIEEKDRLIGKQTSKQGNYRQNKQQNGPKRTEMTPEAAAELERESQMNMERLRKMVKVPQTPDVPNPIETQSQINSPWEQKIEALFQYKITDSVRKYTDLWQTWNLPDSFYHEALQRTLYHAGKFSWAYIHKILDNWHKLQFQSLDEVFAYEKNNRNNGS